MDAYSLKHAQRRRIVPIGKSDANVFDARTEYTTSYQASYFDVPVKGDCYDRAPIGRSQISQVIGISKTTMADQSTTQLASYRNPKKVETSIKIDRINQPKDHGFQPTALEPTRMRCQF